MVKLEKHAIDRLVSNFPIGAVGRDGVTSIMQKTRPPGKVDNHGQPGNQERMLRVARLPRRCTEQNGRFRHGAYMQTDGDHSVLFRFD